MTKNILMHSLLIRSSSLLVYVVSSIENASLRLTYDRGFILSDNLLKLQTRGICHKEYQNYTSLCRLYSTIQAGRLCWEGSSSDVLLEKLEYALKDRQVDEAWEVFKDLKRLHGFPHGSLTSRLITESAYSSNSHWLKKACNMVLLLQRKNSKFLHPDLLTKLSLSLARAQMPSRATMIFRLMLMKENMPPNEIFWSIVLHMVKTEIGTYLASNLLVEISDLFQHLNVKRAKFIRLTKPDTKIFNLVLDACVRFGSSFKGQQLIELMAQIGVIADAHSVVIIAKIHEMNGQRDELKKFKYPIDQVSVPLLCHYRQFYNSLMSLHFKFNDIDAASELVLDLYRCKENPPIQKQMREPQNPCFLAIGSHNLRSGLKLQIIPGLLQKDSVLKLESKQELIRYGNGKLVLSNEGLAKLISLYKRGGKIDRLPKLLISIRKQLGSLDDACLFSDVIDACIHLGWLETAHDILDDMELAGFRMGLSAYISLLTAYHKGKMNREAKALLRQMRKDGFVINVTDEIFESPDLSNQCIQLREVLTLTERSYLAESLVSEIREENKAVPPVVYEFNSSIYFFCKAKMIEDALKTYQRMQEMKIQPTVPTFENLVHGFSSLGMYREITILWGDIKRNVDTGDLVVSRDLLEFLLLNFIKGGYFERVMEVIGYMKKQNMYTDKLMYRSEFLKFHKDLYKNLNCSMARTEAQSKRREFVCAFRQWAGIE